MRDENKDNGLMLMPFHSSFVHLRNGEEKRREMEKDKETECRGEMECVILREPVSIWIRFNVEIGAIANILTLG